MRLRSQRSQIKGMKGGQRQAYERVICENYKGVYRFLAYLCGDVTLAEDLTQDTFVSAWGQLDDFKGRASISTWLRRIAYNKFIDETRRNCRDAKVSKALAEGTGRRELESPIEFLARDEDTRLLYEAIESLDSGHRAAIILRHIEGFRYSQVAEILQKPVGTVKWQVGRTMVELRTVLSGRM